MYPDTWRYATFKEFGTTIEIIILSGYLEFHRNTIPSQTLADVGVSYYYNLDHDTIN